MILLKGLFFIFIVGLLLIVGLILSVVFKVYRLHNQLKKGMHNEGNSSGYGQNTQNPDGNPTVSDRRDPAKANRKIFSDEDGEYVDYVEEEE